MALLASAARAQVGSDRYASIVVDAGTGNVVSAANPDEWRFPASLTKMMTLYMLFEALRDHRVALTEAVPVSPNAASMAPTKLGLVPGSVITVEQAIFGLVTKSANDAACALGEMLGGDEERFAQMMTARAHALGMAHTTFRNASGLPDWNQVTTARDMATLARHLIQDFPEDYHYFSTASFIYAGHIVRSHQHMLTTYPGADGLKTGYTELSGYNVVTSAIHSDTRLIAVVLGASNGGERDAHMARLLDLGFERMGVPPMPPLMALAHRAPAYIERAAGYAAPALRPAPGYLPPPMQYAARAAGPRSPFPFQAPLPRRVPEAQSGRAVAYARTPPPPIRAGTPVPVVIRPAGAAAPDRGATRTAHGTALSRYPG